MADSDLNLESQLWTEIDKVVHTAEDLDQRADLFALVERIEEFAMNITKTTTGEGGIGETFLEHQRTELVNDIKMLDQQIVGEILKIMGQLFPTLTGKWSLSIADETSDHES